MTVETPRRLARSRDDRMLGGVCGGLADYTGIDPVIFRVVFAVAAVLGGAGVAAYVIAWLVIPDAGDEQSHAESLLRDRDRPRFVRIAMYVVAALAILALVDRPFGHRWGGGGTGLLILLALGVWLWVRNERSEGPPPPPPPPPSDGPPPTPDPAPPPTGRTRPLVASDGTTVTAPAETADRPRRRPRERSKLTGLTVSAVLLAAGTMALLDVADLVTVDIGAAFAVCLLVVGAGLVVGAFYGRGPGLIPLGVVLTLLAAVTAVIDVPFRGGGGERTWAPTSIATLERTYRLGAGEAELDLSGLDLAGRSRAVTATVALGQLRVILPIDVAVDLDAHVGFGHLVVLGTDDSGVDVSRRSGLSGDGGRLELDLRVGMGELEVTR